MESFLTEFISPGLNLIASVSLVVGTTAVVCKALQWAPFNITINIYNRETKRIADMQK